MGVCHYEFSLTARITYFPHRADVCRWATKWSYIGQDCLTRIDKLAIRLEDRAGISRGSFTRGLRIEREHPPHAKIGENCFSIAAETERFEEENVWTCEIDPRR